MDIDWTGFEVHALEFLDGYSVREMIYEGSTGEKILFRESRVYGGANEERQRKMTEIKGFELVVLAVGPTRDP